MVWPLQKDVPDVFGKNITIVGGVARASPKWEADNLVKVQLPWRASASWDTSLPIKSLRMHRLVSESLTVVLQEIYNAFAQDQSLIDAAGMNLIGGGYNWRLMRGGNALSMHSYGIACDFDPARNGMGDETPAMSQVVIEAFEKADWVWGGRWARPDGMHFQAARV